jgi:hypothetical protein
MTAVDAMMIGDRDFGKAKLASRRLNRFFQRGEVDVRSLYD